MNKFALVHQLAKEKRMNQTPAFRYETKPLERLIDDEDLGDVEGEDEL